MSGDTNETIDRVMAGQRAFFDRRETRGIPMRIEALKRLELALRERRDEVLAVLADDLGKPEIEAFVAEYYFLLEEIRRICGSLKQWLRPRQVKSPFYFLPCRSRTSREPYGLALVVAPWNYPIQLALSPVVAAVAAGNTVVLKPSEMAAASERFLQRLVGECFPPEHVAVVTGAVEVSGALLERKFDFIFFTGSTEVGRVVARRAAENLTPTVLELGGKCPCVVDATADIPLTARRILAGKLFNAGQTCFAPDFVAVHEDVKALLVDELARLLEALPWETEMARVINTRHYERLRGLLAGREIRKGEDDAGRLHFAPRILPDAEWEHAAMSGEIFGPILPVVGFRNRDDLTGRLRELSSPLAMYVFSRDDDFTEGLMAAIRSGSVCLNDTMKQACNLDLPFGGVGESGAGRYRGKAGVEALSYERVVTTRYFVPDVFEVLPPRAGKVDFLKKWLK